MTDLITHMIHFPLGGGETTPGYLARPTYSGPHRGVVVIQEGWGLVTHIEEVTRRLARSGFVAIAPDLYHGEQASDPDEARKLATEIDKDRAIKEIAAAAKYLKGLDQVSPKWMGVVGWGMGGSLAISATAHSSDFAAAVAFYGRPLDPNDVPQIQAPLLAMYGENDASIPLAWVNEFDREMSELYLPHEVVIYPKVGYGFFNDQQRDEYDETASRDAWDRTQAWLRKHLG